MCALNFNNFPQWYNNICIVNIAQVYTTYELVDMSAYFSVYHHGEHRKREMRVRRHRKKKRPPESSLRCCWCRWWCSAAAARLTQRAQGDRNDRTNGAVNGQSRGARGVRTSLVAVAQSRFLMHCNLEGRERDKYAARFTQETNQPTQTQTPMGEGVVCWANTFRTAYHTIIIVSINSAFKSHWNGLFYAAIAGAWHRHGNIPYIQSWKNIHTHIHHTYTQAIT